MKQKILISLGFDGLLLQPIGMREMLEPVVEELKRLKQEGVTGVYLADDTWQRLQRLAVPIRQEMADHSSGRKATVRDEHAAQTAVATSEPIFAELQAERGPKVSEPVVQQTENAFTVAPIPPPPVVELPDGDRNTQWQWLRKRVLECPVCNTRLRPEKKVVFGVGNIEADIFFCGEAPGAEEEVKGEPFVGPAGQLLTKIIQAMGLSREQVYIANIMNWRPEMPTEFGNRKPTAEEMAFCLPYLRAQLSIVQPKIIVALGATAVDGLLGPDPKRRIGALRGQWHTLEGTPLMVTYHPSYLLRNNTNRTKRMVWEDMLLVMEKVGLSISTRQRSFFR